MGYNTLLSERVNNIENISSHMKCSLTTISDLDTLSLFCQLQILCLTSLYVRVVPLFVFHVRLTRGYLLSYTSVRSTNSRFTFPFVTVLFSLTTSDLGGLGWAEASGPQQAGTRNLLLFQYIFEPPGKFILTQNFFLIVNKTCTNFITLLIANKMTTRHQI